jgi:hypothetical protein
MSKAKPYFHDRIFLSLLTANTFLVIACLIISLLPLMGSEGGVISEYRSNLGLDGYRAGDISDILSFGIFATIIYTFQLFFGIKLYGERKNASLALLSLSAVLLLFALIVCNALLELR